MIKQATSLSFYIFYCHAGVPSLSRDDSILSKPEKILSLLRQLADSLQNDKRQIVPVV